MRARLASALSAVASALLDAAHRIDPETVQLVEELAEDPVEPAAEGDELVAVVPTREIAIGLAMADAVPGAPIIVHNGGPDCTGDVGCGCGAVAYRADRGCA